MTIFDLTTDYNELSGEITTSVIPMYQYEYVALSPEEKIMLMPADAGFGKNSYRNQITYELSLNEVTVVPCVTEERKRYYIKDVSYSMSLYNQQAPNQINGGNIYNAQKDNGAYFTYMDYEYDGVVREKKDFPTDAVVSLGETAISFFAGVLKSVPVVGTLFTCADALISVGNIVKPVFEIGDYLTNPTVYNNVEKHITSENFNPNRDKQINYYGGLLKNMGMVINTTSDEKSIWFGSGNRATGVFKITDNAMNGAADNYTRLVREIGLNIVDIESDAVVEVGTSSENFDLFSPVYEEINLESSNNIYILPESKNYYSFTPEYSGYYDIAISDESNLALMVTDLNNNVITKENYSGYFFENGKNYNLIVSSSTYGNTGTLSVSINDDSTLGNIDKGEKRIIKLQVEEGIYTLTSSNEQVNISDIFVKNSIGLVPYSAFATYMDKPTVSIYLAEGIYYIILENNGMVERSFDLRRTSCPRGIVGAENDIVFDGSNYFYLKFEVEQHKQYTINLKNTDKVEYKIYDLNFNILTPILQGGAVCIVFADTEGVFVRLSIGEASRTSRKTHSNGPPGRYR